MLAYKHRDRGGVWETLEYPVTLERTACNFGGQRSWFLCPARGCGRRSATLYGGRVYACRRCYGLAYPSQRQNLSDRASERAERILERLGWANMATIFDSAPPRRKGMHARTYQRLAAQFEAARYQAFVHGPLGAMDFYDES